MYKILRNCAGSIQLYDQLPTTIFAHNSALKKERGRCNQTR